MNKIKYIFSLILVALCFSCENDGINQENLDQVESKVYLSRTGYIVYSIFDFGEKELVYDVYVNKSGYNNESADILFDTEIMSSGGVNTPDNVTPFPSSIYSIEYDVLHIAADETIAKNTLKINLDEARKLKSENPDVNYVIPISISTDELSPVIVNESRSSMLLSLDLITPIVELVGNGSVYDFSFNPFFGSDEELLLPLEFKVPFENTQYKFDFSCSFDKTLLDEYNSVNGTSYEMLPEGSFVVPEIKIEEGESSNLSNIVVNVNKLPVVNSGKIYMLPVKITSSGNDIIPISDNSVCYFRIKQESKWTGRWYNQILDGETGLSTTPGTVYSTALYSRQDALALFTEATIVAAFANITDDDAILCPGWAGTMFEQCSPIIKITDTDAGNGKKVVEILAGWAREGAGWEPVTTANNMSTYDPATNEIYLDYTGKYSWGDYHIQRVFKNQTALPVN